MYPDNVLEMQHAIEGWRCQRRLQFNGIDITYSINFLKGIGPAAQGYHDCPPASLNPPAPAVEPIRAPALKLNDKIEAGGME